MKDISPTYVGAHIREVVNGSSQAPQAATVARREFSAGQSLWYGAWGNVWTGDGQYNFDEFNKGVNWLTSNGKSPMMHMMVGWDMYNPDWFLKVNWTPQQMDDRLRNLIYAMMDSNDNKNKVDVWNVANELFNDDGAYRNMKWNHIGWEADKSGLNSLTGQINPQHPAFIGKAFRYARDKSSRILELRDFNMETADPQYGWYRKHLAFYQLLKHMLNSNIPIDAVGIQGHYNLGNTAYRLSNNGLSNAIRKFKDLGLSVNLVELDIAAGSNWSATRAEQQRTEYHDVVRQALDGGISRLQTWGIRDGADAGWFTTEHPLLFDESYNPKPAYYGVQSALQEASVFAIRARGAVGGERIELRVNNAPVASWILSRDWAGYYYSGYSGTNNIKVAFTNDGIINGKDRNVQIDYIKVKGKVRQAESRPNTGSIIRGEWMRRNGAIDFGSISTTP